MCGDQPNGRLRKKAMKIKGIIFLHGGGHSSAKRYRDLVAFFQQAGFLTHAFTHQATSLNRRLSEAAQELAKFKIAKTLSDQEIAVWGSSMGSHIASLLTETHKELGTLILQSAALYSPAAEDLPFGPQFTHTLQTTVRWDNSRAYLALERYQGPILVMHGENDQVIPQIVKNLYQTRAEKNGQYLTITGGGHSLLRPANSIEKQAWNTMANSALQFLQTR